MMRMVPGKETLLFEEVLGVRKPIQQRPTGGLVLRGRRGRKLFERIKNAPAIPYERLKAISEASQDEILKKRHMG